MKRSAWTLLVALLIGAAGGGLLCPDVLDSVSREIITALSIQAGAMMTTMIFTAGLAKNDSLSPKQTAEVSKKLRGILIFLISVFCVDLAAIGAIIFARIQDWHLRLVLPGQEAVTDLSFALLGLVLFLTSWALLRLVPYFRALIGLYDLNATIALEASRMRAGQEIDDRHKSVEQFKRSDDFGKRI